MFDVVELITFLKKPPHGKIRAINSPFAHEVFRIAQAERWIETKKARIEHGVLVFLETFSTSVMQREAEQRQADEQYEREIDYMRSGGQTAKASHAQWISKSSGGVKVRQMKRVWPTGTFTK